MDPSATVVRSQRALWRRLPDRVLVLGDGDDVLQLSGTAAAVWDELARPIGPAELTERLAARYRAAPEVVAADLGTLLARLLDVGALDVGALDASSEPC